MRDLIGFLALLLCLCGCHSGPAGAAAISGSISLIGIANQDALEFLHIGTGTPATVPMPPSKTTSATN